MQTALQCLGAAKLSMPDAPAVKLSDLARLHHENKNDLTRLAVDFINAHPVHGNGLKVIASIESVIRLEYEDGRTANVLVVGRSENSSLFENDVKDFLEQRKDEHCIVFTTTNNISEQCQHLLDQHPSSGLITFSDIESSSLQLKDGTIYRILETHRPDQEDAIVDIACKFITEDRTQLHAACGTGKTRTSLGVYNELNPETAGFFAPSLGAVRQALIEYTTHTNQEFNFLVVCSDASTVQDLEYKHQLEALGVPVTTDPAKVKAFLESPGNKVIFSTYHSSAVVGTALVESNKSLGLLVADEAHHCAGKTEGFYQNVLTNDIVPADKRLFMTATPRVIKSDESQTTTSMDDPNTFGEVAYTLSFAKAVELKLLAPYQVVVVGVPESEASTFFKDDYVHVKDKPEYKDSLNNIIAALALFKLAKEQEVESVISFHGSVAKAQEFINPENPGAIQNVYQRLNNPPERKPWVAHVNGKTPVGTRSTLLSDLVDQNPAFTKIMTNCRVLIESGNFPALRAILPVGSKESAEQIIQMVGRVMRIKPQGGEGLIILPVVIPDGSKAEQILELSDFKTIAKVIQALMAHDDKLYDCIKTLATSEGLPGTGTGEPRLTAEQSPIRFMLPEVEIAKLESILKPKFLEIARRGRPLTLEFIREAVEDFITDPKNAGNWPHKDSGAIILNNQDSGYTWKKLDRWLSGDGAGGRVLNFTSLSDFLTKEFNKPLRHVSLNLEFIHQAVSEFIAANPGKWPGQSGVVYLNGEATEFSWQQVYGWLKSGNGKSLGYDGTPDYLTKVFGKPKVEVQDLSTLNLDLLRQAVTEFRAANPGQWPVARLGNIIIGGEISNVTWLQVTNWLNDGSGKVYGYTGIHDYLVKEHGKPEVKKQDLFALNLDLIRTAITEFRTHNLDGYPLVDSSPILIDGKASRFTWRQADSRLRRHYDSSLTSLCTLEFGKPADERKDLSALSLDIIRQAVIEFRAKNPQKWPNPDSGLVMINGKDSGFTWQHIESRLRTKELGYGGLGQYLKKEFQKPEIKKQDLSGLNLDFARQAVTEFRATNTKGWPNEASGSVMINGKDSGFSWGNINSLLKRKEHGYTGLNQYLTKEFGKPEFEKRDMSDLNLEVIHTAVTEFRASHNGEFPNNGSGTVSLNYQQTNYNWSDINQWIAARTKLHGYTGLVNYLEKEFQKPKRLIEIDLNFVRKAVIEFRNKHPGKWPHTASGQLIINGEKQDCTWTQVNDWFRGRGKNHGYAKLSNYLTKEFSKPTRELMDLSKLTLDLIHHAAVGFRSQNLGANPNVNSGKVVIMDQNYKWSQINDWFSSWGKSHGYSSLANYTSNVFK